ncbi:MAG: helix-turn-helix domain-containing protein [Marinifilaceae bacterium]|nr:helix-turn-helix domain-containing protein [Marinifilaceae bacterium]
MNNTIKKYQFKEGLKLEFEILDLSEILKSRKDMMTIPHRAQFNHILWIEKGKGTHFVDFNPISIEDNTIIFIPHNCVNRFDKNGIYKGKTILFTNNFFSKNNQDLQFLHSSILYSDLYNIAKIKVNQQRSDLKVFLNAMETEFQRSADSAQYQILRNMLHIFLLQAEREMRKQGFEELKPSANLDYLVLFKDLLEQNFRKEKSVNKYASELSISEKQLHKATTTLFDKTPKQIIDERILLEAKRLLVHSNQSIKEIAYELGYDEPTNFIKYFRKHVHSTPSEFREQS